MASTPAGNDRILPGEGRRTPGARGSTAGLPIDVVRQSASRLRILALLYASVFAVAAYAPAVLLPEVRAHVLAGALHWLPGLIAIGVALVVAAIVRSARVSLPTVMTIGLVFEVVGSYGIASAEFLNMAELDPKTGWFGLSWVAVWTLLFSVVIPTQPRRALVASSAAVSAVPVVTAMVMWSRPNFVRPAGTEFFVGLVLPYVLVVMMAYVGARVVYSLGTEVKRARELGSYHLVERLGHGGMGEVWRARHRLLARPAAIKLIRSSPAGDGRSPMSEEDARRRFEREAQVIASLRSPHTIGLFDFGVEEDGTFYYVMELLEGLDADALVRKTGPVPPARAIHILKQMCRSLSEAHARGLVHRDIKPANVFLCQYGEDFDFVKVLDFGIVKAAEEVTETRPALTVQNAVHGTPAFIAPEQALAASAIDGRADIYATGCVAYWLLTGQLVFDADTPLGYVMHHVHTVPAPPSARTEMRIPAALDALVLSCLAKDPAQRPQSARDLSHRLEAIDAADVWTEDQARVWWAIHQPEAAERAFARS